MKTGVDILIAYKMDFKEFKDKEGYFIIKESKKRINTSGRQHS